MGIEIDSSGSMIMKWIYFCLCLSAGVDVSLSVEKLCVWTIIERIGFI